MKKAILLLVCMMSFAAYSQEKSKFIYAEISDKSVSLTPFYKVIGSSFDPALSLGGGINYMEKGSSAIFQQAQITFYSARMVGNGLSASTSIGYRYTHNSGIFAEVLLGVVASAFLPSGETFSQDENNVYMSTNPLHLIAGVPIDLRAGYMLGSYSVYLKYRYMVEGTYTDILPMIPTSLIGIGIRYNLDTEN